MDILEKIKLNPKNPRQISETRFIKLKESIQKFPKMLELRPIVVKSDGIILGGNMRYRAIQDLGLEMKKEWIKIADKLTNDEELRFIIEDNLESGQWDWDILGNEWSDLPLEEWGLPIGNWSKDINEEWEGMPEFDTTPIFKSHKSLNVHFETQKDVDDFADLISQQITEKTKYVWYPKKEKEELINLKIKADEI